MAARNEDDIKNEKLSQRYAEARNKLLAEREERLSRIAEKERKLSEIQNGNYQTQEEYNRALEEETKLLQDILDIEKESQDIAEDILDLEEKTNKTRKKTVDMVRERFENEEKIQDRLDEQNISLELQKKAQGRLKDAARDYAGTSDITAKIIEQQALTTGRVAGLQRQGVDLSESFLANLEKTDEVSNSIKSIQQDITQSVEEAATGQYKAQDFSKAHQMMDERRVRLAAERLNVGTSLATMDERELQILEDQLKADEEHLQNLIDQDGAMKEASKQAEKTLGVYNKILEGDFGGALRKQFSMDEIQSDIKKKLGGALVNVIKDLKAGNISGAFSAAGKGLKEMISIGPKLLAALGIGAILMLGNFLLDTFMKADAEVAELGKEFGISKNEAKELHHVSVDVANEMGVVGIHAEQIGKSLKTVSENLGGIDLTGAFSSGNAAVQQMVKDTTLLTEKFGLSAEEAGNMSNIAAITGTSVGELSMKASTLGKGIFSAKESMKILAGIPKSIVSQMAKMPEAMIKTAMHAKMLGMNMKQIADIGRKSLDIEQSLEAEMEARALIGKDINLDAMRAAALNGDQETVMNELLKTAGSMEDFNKMNVLQKEALAKAAGMEVDQMAEMLGKQEELNKAGLSQAKVKELQAMNEKDLAKEIANTNDKNKKAYLEKIAAEKKSESTQAAMASLMQRLQELAVKLVTPLMDMVDAFLNGQDGADAMGGIIDGIGGAIKMIVPYIKAFATIIGYLLKPLGWIGSMFKSTEETTKGVSEGVGKVSGALKPVEAGFGDILGVVTAIGGFFLGKSLLFKGFGLLKDKALDFGSTVLSKVGGAFTKVGEKAFSSISDGFSKMGEKVYSGTDGLTKKLTGKFSKFSDFLKDKIGGKVADKAKDAVADKGMDLASKAPLPDGPPKKAGGFSEFFEKMDPKKMLAGAAALLIVAAALYVAAKAMQEFSTGVKWEGVAMGIVTLGALVLAVIALGALMNTGVGAVAIIAGAGALMILSAALFVMGKAMQEFSKAAVMMMPVFETLFKMDPAKLLGVAVGITALGAAIAAFGVMVGAGGLIGGITGRIGELFGGDSPIEQIMEISKKLDGSKLMTTAQAIKELANAFKYFTEETAKLKDFDTGKLDDIIERMEKVQKAQQGNALAGAITGVANSITSFVGGIFGSSEKQTAQPVVAGAGGVGAVAGGGGGTNMANVEKKLDTLISVISQAANQPMVIKFGEKTIEEIKSQLNFRKGTSIGVNKTYAKTTE